MATASQITEDKLLEENLSASDEYYDFTCTPCTKEKRNIQAKKYCVDCKNYLCENCIKQHNRFGLMKNHRIVDKTKAKRYNSEQSNVVPSDVVPSDVIPVQTCDAHIGKILDMFCENHEEVCCAACAVIYHSGCKGMVYLPNVVKNFVDDKQNFKDIFDKLDVCRMNTAKLKLARLKHSEIFECSKKDIIEEVKYMKKRVEKHFSNLENKLIMAIEQENTQRKAVIDTDVNDLDDVIAQIKHQKENLEKFSETDNVASLFVQTRIANKCIEESEKVVKLIETKTGRNIYFLPNREVNRLLDLAMLGEIVDNIPECNAELINVVSIKSIAEKSLPTYSGICSLEDGSKLICDWQNESLMHLDEDYNIVKHIELPGQPFGICAIDSTTVAISFPKLKEVYFVSTENEVHLTSSFHTQSQCRGIAYATGLIYVACGEWKTNKDTKNHIAVFSISGELQSFRCDQHFSQLGHIALYGSRLYITDSHNGLLIMDENGVVSKIFTHKHMNNPLAVSAGHGNQLFLGGWSSHNIMMLNNEAQLSKVLLSQKDGVKNIHSLFFDKMRSQLIYTIRDSRKIKIYALTY